MALDAFRQVRTPAGEIVGRVKTTRPSSAAPAVGNRPGRKGDGRNHAREVSNTAIAPIRENWHLLTMFLEEVISTFDIYG